VRRKWQTWACYNGIMRSTPVLGSFLYNKVKGKPRTANLEFVEKKSQ